MSKHTLTIELARPLEWVRVEKDEDMLGLKDTRNYAIRKDGRVWSGYLNKMGEVGLRQFQSFGHIVERGPDGHFPFEVALIETPPWPLVYKYADGWIDLEKTPVGLLAIGYYELRGDWEGSAWGWWNYKDNLWEVSTGNSRASLPPPFNNPTSARVVASSEVPKEWLNGPPAKPETREERLEKEVAGLRAKLAAARAALGEWGGE